MSGSDKVVAGIALVLAMWGLSRLSQPEGGSWVHPQGAVPGRVRILHFRASVGALIEGQKAELCYGVENARTVRIAPGPAPAEPECPPENPPPPWKPPLLPPLALELLPVDPPLKPLLPDPPLNPPPVPRKPPKPPFELLRAPTPSAATPP